LLGIKVVPFAMPKGADAVEMIRNDIQRKKLETAIEANKRKVIQLIWRLGRFLRLPAIKDRAITGDPKRDILWASTLYKKRVSLLLSQTDIDENNLFAQPKDVLKLFKLGWSSIMVADDVNKQATFCMKEFSGMCNVVPYAYLFASLGKEQAKVYEDLEDVRRSAGPFFRMKVPMRKIMGEAIAYEKFKKYDTYMSEDVSEFVSKFGSSKIQSALNSLKKSNDEEAIKSKLNKLPKVQMSSIERFASKMSATFKKDYNTNKIILSNSLDLPSNITDKAALILTVGSSQSASGPSVTKLAIVQYVSGMRKIQKSVGDIAGTFLKGLIAILLATLVAIAIDKLKATVEPIIINMKKSVWAGLKALLNKILGLSTTKQVVTLVTISLLLLVILSRES
jgi:hypothetical protein